jgi:hypothetical protein
MRQQDQDIFLSKLAQAKQYYLQNRDKILNPAKYGAEFQSTYNAGLREAQNLIGQSKQAYGEDKAFKTYIDQLHKSGKALDENQVFVTILQYLAKEGRAKMKDFVGLFENKLN